MTLNKHLDVGGKRPPVIITGIGKRVGFALALALLEDGHNIVGTYRTEYPEIVILKEKGATLFQIDFYDHTQVEKFIKEINSRFNAIRAIIHNASDWLPDQCEQSHHAIINKMMQIHTILPYQLNQAFADKLKATESMSDIIHITDYVVERGSKKHIAYAASKASMHNLTLSFAQLLAPKVKVNSIAPALIKFNENDNDAYKEKAKKKSLLAKEAGYEEVVSAVKYLMQSGYVTGRAISLDGGRHLVFR